MARQYNRMSPYERYVYEYNKARESKRRQGLQMFDLYHYDKSQFESMYNIAKDSGEVRNASEFIRREIQFQSYGQSVEAGKAEKKFLAEHGIKAKSRELRSLSSTEFSEKYVGLVDDEYWKARGEGKSPEDARLHVSTYIFGS